MVPKQKLAIPNIIALTQCLREESIELGAYQFVVPLNNSNKAVTSAVKDLKLTETEEKTFYYGKFVNFPNSVYRPTKLVILEDTSSLFDYVVKYVLDEEEKLLCNFNWHATQVETQSMFLSIGFQKGLCWPWHVDKTTHKFHKLLLGEANFLYTNKKVPLTPNVLQRLPTSEKHTLEQLSPIRVDLIFDSKDLI